MKATQFAVTCDIHGKSTTNNKGDRKWVMVGTPKNRNDRKNGGCPMCKRERALNEKQ